MPEYKFSVYVNLAVDAIGDEKFIVYDLMENTVLVKPNVYLGREEFKEILRLVKMLGGEYVGFKRAFEIPLFSMTHELAAPLLRILKKESDPKEYANLERAIKKIAPLADRIRQVVGPVIGYNPDDIILVEPPEYNGVFKVLVKDRRRPLEVNDPKATVALFKALGYDSNKIKEIIRKYSAYNPKFKRLVEYKLESQDA